jgi:hypothetical protein
VGLTYISFIDLLIVKKNFLAMACNVVPYHFVGTRLGTTEKEIDGIFFADGPHTCIMRRRKAD